MMNGNVQTGFLVCLFLGWLSTCVAARSADLLMKPNALLKRKQMRLLQYALCLVPSLLAFFLKLQVFSAGYLALQVLVLFVSDLLFYKGKWPLRLACWGMSAAALAGVFFFWQHAAGGSIDSWQLESAALCITGMTGFLWILVLFMVFEWIGRGKRPDLTSVLMIGANGLPAGLLCGYLFSLLSQKQAPDLISLVFYLACYALVLIFFSVFFFQRSTSRAWNALEEAREMAAMQEEYSQSMKRHAASLQNMQEDFAGTARETLELIRSGKTEQAQKNLEALNARIQTTRPVLFTPSPIVNAILSQKKALCDNQNIVFEPELMLQKRPGVEELDLCIALGNLMDNAIRNADLMENEHRWIHLSAKIIAGVLVIVCRNPFRMENRGKIQHTGFGHQILQDLARRYGGTFEAEGNDDGIFTATLCLSCKD